jgi:DNA-binding NtrC family response regulator
MATKLRADRRRVRLRCALVADSWTATGFSHNVSTTGIFVRVPRDQVHRVPESGSHVRLSVALHDDEAPLELSSQIVWRDPDDHDLNDRPALGMALRFLDPPTEPDSRLSLFLRGFRYTVLGVDDEPHARDLLERVLRPTYRVIACESAASAFEILEREEVAVLITDQRMPKASGLEFFQQLAKRLPHVHTVKVVVSAYADAGEIQEFVNRGGIYHYMTKPYRVEELVAVVGRAVDLYALSIENERLQNELARANNRLRDENTRLRQEVATTRHMGAIIGPSRAMRRVMETIETVAASDATVLISGETGTGKELVARALHRLSKRADAPFVAVNSAALPEGLIENELFGHERGAFTGAHQRVLGRFERAHQGTLFLDEVGDVPAATQAKLLRVLQEGAFERLGGTTLVETDVRLIAATHRDLAQRVASGEFRSDLFYRLNVVPIHLPPLRERREDIAPLLQHYLEHFQTKAKKTGIRLSERKRAALERYAWPGNIRELINTVERIVALSPSGVEDDSIETPATATLADLPVGPLKRRVDDFEKGLLVSALARHDGNITHAARELEVSRQTLSVKLGKYRL